MNKFAFLALMTSWTLTMTGLAPAMASSEAPAREPTRVIRVVRTPAPTWTCARNTYRSVECP